MFRFHFPDWFSTHIPNFLAIKDQLSQRNRIMEIGSFEGRSTCWLLQNFVDDDGYLLCLDTFNGSPEHANLELGNLIERWRFNTEQVRTPNQKCVAYVGKSYQALAHLIGDNESFDFIYVDGSHAARDVLVDACMAWNLLRVGGIILFNDYRWDEYPSEPKLEPLDCPKLAVNSFIEIFADQGIVIFSNYQLAFKRIR